jgi:hypothetical protein
MSSEVTGSIDKALINFSALRGGVSIQGGCVEGVGGGVCLALSSMFDVYEYMIRGIRDGDK